MPTVPALEILWNFNIFSKFTKFYQSYWNHHQKHACPIEEVFFHRKRLMTELGNHHQNSPYIKLACEIWCLFREVKFFHRKMLTLPALQNVMKFQHFFKVHLISSNLQNILESSSETCMWSLSHSEKLTYFKEKCRQCRPFEISWNFNIFFKIHLISSNL